MYPNGGHLHCWKVQSFSEERENNRICISLGASELHIIPNDVQLVKERIWHVFYEGLRGFIIHGEAVLIMYLLIVHLK